MVLLTMLMDQRQKTHVFLILSITSTRSFFLQEQVTLRKSSTCLPMLSEYCLRFLSWTTSKLSTTSFAVILLSWPEQNAVSLNRFLLSLLLSVRHSLLCILPCMLRHLCLKCRSTEQKLIWLTPDGTEQASVFLSRIHVLLSMLSLMVLSKTQKRLLFQY